MTFELSSEQQALQARAKSLAAEQITPAAEAVDRDAAIPASLRAAIAQASLIQASSSAADAIVVTEECAVASAAAGVAIGLAYAGVVEPPADAALPGLRGLGAFGELAPAALTRTRLVLAAAAVGIARAAVDEALRAARAAGDRPSGNADERPHWVLADAATEVDAARLLTQKAAQAVEAGAGDAEVSLAKLFAADVAERAVDAALRILGPSGYRRGAVLERLARDARAIAYLGGTAEEQRAIVADLTFQS